MVGGGIQFISIPPPPQLGNGKENKGVRDDEGDDIDQGLWILVWMSSCSKFLIIGVNWGH